MLNRKLLIFVAPLFSASLFLAQTKPVTVGDWQMQDIAKLKNGSGESVSSPAFDPLGWYKATVPGTVLTTLVDNKVYPDPLYGENMRAIPESLNRTSYWYRTALKIPSGPSDRRVWLHFAGINYAAEIWMDGKHIGSMKGAFRRGDFDITSFASKSQKHVLAVLIAPQPHPGKAHEHTLKDGTGHNGGESSLDGPTFLSSVGWDWIPAIRDRNTGIWLPVTLSFSGPVSLDNTNVTSTLTTNLDSADLAISADLKNSLSTAIHGSLVGTITGGPQPITFRKKITLAPESVSPINISSSDISDLHIASPRLWWPNGYGEPNLYHLQLRFEVDGHVSDETVTQFGIRKVAYEVAGSDNLTLVVNNVPVMARGGNWGMDDALKKIPHERLDAELRMHKIANLNMIRNWVGQSTSPDFYDLADKYGIMLWDEFFQPNPGDGPNVSDYDTYLANVKDKVLRYRSHPSIVVWCARNEGRPPEVLDKQLSRLMKDLDPQRLYQSSSTDGRGVSSHGPYYWRAPQFFYQINEAFKTETGSVSVPTIESIQGMMPQKDWESINEDWAQHDMTSGAQRGNEYPFTLAKRYGHIRNLADFVRKAQLANYEAFRAMYESRNATMFQNTTGIITWLSQPAQPSFVWQLYHYDLEPNASLFAVKKANEPIHVQMNEALRTIQVVNNRPQALHNFKVKQTVYRFDGKISKVTETSIPEVAPSSTYTSYVLWVDPHVSELYFVKLDLFDESAHLVSSNLYWKNVAQDSYAGLEKLPQVNLHAEASVTAKEGVSTIELTLTNPSSSVALMNHLQLHRKSDGQRVLPTYYSDNYISLAPGETRTISIEAKSAQLSGGPLVLLDGFNATVMPSSGAVEIRANENADPAHWPATDIVPDNGVPLPEPPLKPLDL